MSTPSPKPPYWKATIPNGRRRAPWHDYHARCIYMVTANKHAAAPTFGRLIILEDLTRAYIDPSAAGKIIIDAIRDTPSHNPEIRILEFGLMPDHFHLLLFVTSPMRRTLGEIVQAIKATVTRKAREAYQSPDLNVFEPGFHDRILMHEGQLATLYQYIRDNPRRLAVRQRYPLYIISSLAGSLCTIGIAIRLARWFRQQHAIRFISVSTLMICGMHIPMFYVIERIAGFIGLSNNIITTGFIPGLLFAFTAFVLTLPLAFLIERHLPFLTDKPLNPYK